MRSPPPGPRARANPAETVTNLGEPARIDLALSVVAEGFIGVYPLPVAGQVTIGRDPLASFTIDHPSLSRRHAAIEVGPVVTIADLGSKNGTRVCERALERGERRPLAVGDTIALGGVRAVVLALGAREKRAGFLGAAALRARVEYECARARRGGSSFEVVRFRIEGAIGDDEVAAIVAGVVGSNHATTALEAGEFVAVVPEREGEDGRTLVARVAAAVLPRAGVVRHGIAMYPADAPSPEALLLRAAQLLNGEAEAPLAVLGRTVVVVDESMLRLHALAKRVAAATVSVLLLGETGCGKEILAETIHAASARKKMPFVRLNCAAFTENLLESELFGHEKGAFSGATHAKAGLLETAHGGTALLDEVGELPLPLQAKLLRFLEDGQTRRLGGLRARQLDVRIVAATNRDLARDVERGTFRADLFHRLAGFTLTIPPLRERPAELAALAQQFIDEAAQEQRRTAPRLTPDALARLNAHRWPGNVRELRNVVRAALIVCEEGSELRADHLPLQTDARPPAPPPRPGRSPAAPFRDPAEALRITEALARCGGNQARAAELLGISRTTLLKRMLAFGLRSPNGASPFEDPDERKRVVDALAACGGNRAQAAARLGVSRSALVMRMLAFGLHGPDGDGDAGPS